MKWQFCPYCGTELDENSRFCKNCGMEICNNVRGTDNGSDKEYSSSEHSNERKTIYEGCIFKCPNCGEPLKSFTANCPACGMELRATKASDAVREFANKLEMIETQRGYDRPTSIFKRLGQSRQISKTDEQKITLIKSFSVPNTAEDILEFMILATSNVDMSVYSTMDEPTVSAKAMNDAWNAKIKQVYAKAKNICRSESDFSRIQELYNSYKKELVQNRRKKAIKWVCLIGGLISIFPLIGCMVVITEKVDENKEIKRLETTVEEVQEALDGKEYKLALDIADSIDYQRSDTITERKWDIQRAYWVEKVLAEAAQNGIELEYIPSPDVDNTKNGQEDEKGDDKLVDGIEEEIAKD